MTRVAKQQANSLKLEGSVLISLGCERDEAMAFGVEELHVTILQNCEALEEGKDLACRDVPRQAAKTAAILCGLWRAEVPTSGEVVSILSALRALGRAAVLVVAALIVAALVILLLVLVSSPTYVDLVIPWLTVVLLLLHLGINCKRCRWLAVAEDSIDNRRGRLPSKFSPDQVLDISDILIPQRGRHKIHRNDIGAPCCAEERCETAVETFFSRRKGDPSLFASMETLKRFAQRGHKERSEEIDETSGKWKARAGRTEGPDTYQAGDLCRAIFRHACALSHRERNNVYGGSVILVGIAAARGVPLPEGSKQIWFVESEA